MNKLQINVLQKVLDCNHNLPSLKQNCLPIATKPCLMRTTQASIYLITETQYAK